MSKRRIIVAKEVAKGRVDKDWTQEDLARVCGVTQEAIGKLERSGQGSLALKRRVAEQLGRPFAELFPREAAEMQETLRQGVEPGMSSA